MRKFFKLFISVVSFLPTIVLAQAVPNGQTAQGLIFTAASLFSQVPKILIAILIIIILWYGVQYARFADSKEGAKYREAMFIGVGILAVAFSIFGIIQILQNTVFGGIATSSGVQVLQTGGN